MATSGWMQEVTITHSDKDITNVHLRPRQDSRHVGDLIIKSIFLNDMFCSFIEISVKCVSEYWINN